MEKKYVNFEVLSEDSEDVKELISRWEGGDKFCEDESRKQYAGYSDTNVYAFLGSEGEPVMYVSVKTDIEAAYNEYKGRAYQVEGPDGTMIENDLTYEEARKLVAEYAAEDIEEEEEDGIPHEKGFYYIRNIVTDECQKQEDF